MWNDYEMEELVPVVAALAEKYCGIDSTSVTYERAQQLMEAVQYCIGELYKESRQSGRIFSEKLPPKEAYELGRKCVEEKTKEALKLYHSLLTCFDAYENRCLEETVLKGIPEFFRRYDIVFAPQETVIFLDYPVQMDLSGYTGVDAVYLFLKEVADEQKYLAGFQRESILEALRRYSPEYRDIIENVRGIFQCVSFQCMK